MMKEIILDYMGSGLSKVQYNRKRKFEANTLRNSIKFMKENFSLEEIDVNEDLKEFSLIKSQIYHMVDGIKNGVTCSNKEIRKYDVIDFYMDSSISARSLNEFAKIILSNEDLIQFRTFLSSNKLINTVIGYKLCFDTASVLNGYSEIGCQKDEEGNLIFGTGRVVSLEEKMYTIEFMKKYNVPLLSTYYNIALNRCLNGTLLDKEENVNNKKYIKE